MKLASTAVIALVLGMAVIACGNANGTPEVEPQPEQPAYGRNKVLVVYFSHTGNTRVVAEKIQQLTGGDIFEIVTEHTYPQDYNQCVKQAQQELRDGFRPKLTAAIANIADYDTVFVGYPNWFGTMPTALFSFLETHDLAEKSIVPFCTHGGGRLGVSVDDIRQLCPRSDILEGLAVKGTNVNNSQPEIVAWLNKLGFGQ